MEKIERQSWFFECSYEKKRDKFVCLHNAQFCLFEKSLIWTFIYFLFLICCPLFHWTKSEHIPHQPPWRKYQPIGFFSSMELSWPVKLRLFAFHFKGNFPCFSKYRKIQLCYFVPLNHWPTCPEWCYLLWNLLLIVKRGWKFLISAWKDLRLPLPKYQEWFWTPIFQNCYYDVCCLFPTGLWA